MQGHLVARGFTQEYGIDYEMDVKNAFLNGDLSDVVYVQPPPGVTALLGMCADFNRLFMV